MYTILTLELQIHTHINSIYTKPDTYACICA